MGEPRLFQQRAAGEDEMHRGARPRKFSGAGQAVIGQAVGGAGHNAVCN